MSLSQKVQSLIYDLDDLLYQDCYCKEKIEKAHRELDIKLMALSAASIDESTPAYQEAASAIQDAKDNADSAREDLEKAEYFVEKLTKVVDALTRIA